MTKAARIWLPDGLPPVCAAGRRAARPGARTSRRHAGAPRRIRARTISTRARSRRRSPPISAPAAASCRPPTSPQCRARIVPSLEIPYRGYSLHAARGLTAAPTLADVLDRLSSKRFPQAPDAVYFETLIDALAAGLSRAARRARRHQAARRELHDAHHRDRPRRRHRGADDDAAVELRQPLCAAADRHPDEQRRHVVRPAAGPAQFDGAGQARADQHVPARRRARRPRPLRGRRIGRAAHPGRGRAAGELHRRFRDDPGGGGASAADRRQRRDRHRDRPALCRS